MDKAAKLILNSLRCPLCGGQIDLRDITINKRGNNFVCVNNATHYAIFFVHWEQPSRIEKETVMIYDGPHLYQIVQEYYVLGRSFINTRISIRDIDPEGRIIDKGKFKSLDYKKSLFDFSKSNEEKIIGRIKTILVFQ